MKPQPINSKPQQPAHAVEEPQVIQLGIIMTTLGVLGASATMDFEQITSSKVYNTGSVLNEGTATVYVRLFTSLFNGGYADIPLAPGEAIKFKRLPIHTISVPASPPNAGITPSIKVVSVGFAYTGALEEPEIVVS